MPADYWAVPREWAGQTACILGGGPSLTQAQVDYCRGRARVIAINNAYRLAPWADVLYAADHRWWEWHDWCEGFAGLRVTQDHEPHTLATLIEGRGIKVLRRTFPPACGESRGFDPDPSCIRTGQNGGYQAIHLAAHFGAKRIVLLGYDMKPDGDRTQWHAEHKVPTNLGIYRSTFLPNFPHLAAPLAERGIEVINATPNSALTVWPLRRLEEVI